MVVLLKEDIDAFLNGGGISGYKKLTAEAATETDAETTTATCSNSSKDNILKLVKK